MKHLSRLRVSLRRVTWGACLFMVFNTGVTSPMITKFIEQLGATPTQIGFYSGIPMIALGMQFVGAILARRMRARKPWFMAWMIASRFLYLPVFLVPILIPSLRNPAGVNWMISLLFLSNLLNHMATPLWYSWMGDLLPPSMISRYWGARQTWGSAVWAVSYLVVMLLSWVEPLPFYPLVAAVVAVSVVVGVWDICLFARVYEPPPVLHPPEHPWRIFLQPLADPLYRQLVAFFSAWNAATFCAAAFMGFYAFKVLDMPVWQVTLVWCGQGLGTTVSANGWGRLASRRGSVFVLRVCFLFKIWIALAFFLATPGNAFVLLGVVMFFDGMWNAAYGVGQNGVMFHAAPTKNRAMFVAAMNGISGLVGGLGAMVAGKFLDAGPAVYAAPWGSMNPYQVLFLASTLMRVGMAVWAWRLPPDRPDRSGPWLNDLVGVWPFRLLRYPVDAYTSRVARNRPQDSGVFDLSSRGR